VARSVTALGGLSIHEPGDYAALTKLA
jgi:hypothetical protein